jgi:hypothetical protein
MREDFKPDRIRFLMVGESPPRKGFFYDPESSLKSLSRGTAEVFEEVYGEDYGKGEDQKLLFLNSFQSKGFYLHDFYAVRGKKVRRRRWDDIYEGIDELRSLLEVSKADIGRVVTVWPEISDIVDEALWKEEIKALHRIVPFPSNVSMKVYKWRISEIVKEFEGRPRSHSRNDR